MSAARRIPLAAVAILFPLAAVACGHDTKPTTTTVAGARTPEVHAVAAVTGTPAEAPVVVTYADGDAAYRTGHYSEAARLFTSYAERHPGNVTAQYMAGLASWKQGDLKAAAVAFDRALAIDSTHLKTLLNSSRVLIELGRTDDALDRINTVIGIDSSSGIARRLQGRVLEAKGDFEGAIDAYQQALLNEERDVWAMNNLGLLYIQLGRPEEALAPLARAVELKENAPVFQNNLGIALEETGHYAKATEAFSAALDADSTYAKSAVNLARVQGRADSTGSTPITLSGLAQSFQLQIRMLKDSARIVEPDSSIAATQETAPPVNEPQR